MSWLDYPHLKAEFAAATAPVLTPLPEVADIPPLPDTQLHNLAEIIDPDQRN